MGEWDNPYLTMSYDYEATIAGECCRFALDGSLFRSKKPIHWCCSCKTALAEAEIEYADEGSPSIYVRFPFSDDLGDIDPALKDRQVDCVIWTTTPWTLPANLAIALHPEFVYAAVEAGDGRVYLLARDLVESCMAKFGLKEYRILCELTAPSLERRRCRHPFYNRESIIVLGEHVTLDAGTGCVHTAPGHGREDYDVGLLYGLDPYSPVDDRGVFYRRCRIVQRTVRVRGQSRHYRTSATNRIPAGPGEPLPQLSPLLALQEAGDFQGHAPMVHLHGKNRTAVQIPERDRPCGMGAPLGPGTDLRHDRKPAGLVRIPPAGLGCSDCPFLLP